MTQLPGQVISERATAPIVETQAATRDPLAELERLHNLKEKGAITTEEFERMKAALLGTAPPSTLTNGYDADNPYVSKHWS
jgi:multidrug resistance efflux pump